MFTVETCSHDAHVLLVSHLKNSPGFQVWGSAREQPLQWDTLALCPDLHPNVLKLILQKELTNKECEEVWKYIAFIWPIAMTGRAPSPAQPQAIGQMKPNEKARKDDGRVKNVTKHRINENLGYGDHKVRRNHRTISTASFILFLFLVYHWVIPQLLELTFKPRIPWSKVLLGPKFATTVSMPTSRKIPQHHDFSSMPNIQAQIWDTSFPTPTALIMRFDDRDIDVCSVGEMNNYWTTDYLEPRSIPTSRHTAEVSLLAYHESPETSSAITPPAICKKHANMSAHHALTFPANTCPAKEEDIKDSILYRLQDVLVLLAILIVSSTMGCIICNTPGALEEAQRVMTILGNCLLGLSLGCAATIISLTIVVSGFVICVLRWLGKKIVRRRQWRRHVLLPQNIAGKRSEANILLELRQGRLQQKEVCLEALRRENTENEELRGRHPELSMLAGKTRENLIKIAEDIEEDKEELEV